MRSETLATLSIIAIGLPFGTPPPTHAQVSSSGSHGMAIGVVNGNVVVRGASTPTLRNIAEKLNAIKERGALTQNELALIIALINETILPSLSVIQGDTQRANAKLDDILDRLGIAADYPTTARDVLRPFLTPRFDLSNSSYDVNEFLDSNGRKEYRLVFALTGDCAVFIRPPRETGFEVGIGVFSENDTPIWRALQGTQGRYSPIRLPTGVYQFKMWTKRNAGTYSATVSARCG